MTTEPRKIWAVEDGQYSDYRVLALFERQEDANAAVLAGLGDAASEFWFYPAGQQPHQIGYWRAQADMWADGSVKREPTAWALRRWTCDYDAPTSRRPVVEERKPQNHGHTMIMATAPTEKAAIKAVADRLARLRVELLEVQP